MKIKGCRLQFIVALICAFFITLIGLGIIYRLEENSKEWGFNENSEIAESIILSNPGNMPGGSMGF